MPSLSPPSEPWRVVMVFPQHGPAGIYGPSCEAVTELAVSELRDAGGVLGRDVEVDILDGGSDAATVAGELNSRIEAGRVDAVAGWHISTVRNALAPVVAGRVPYVFTALYEGGEERPGIFCTGEIPVQQISPALQWLRDNLGARRWFVVGNDYVWARQSFVEVQRFAREQRLSIEGSAFMPLGGGREQDLVRAVEHARCDGVLMLLVGDDAVRFNRLFAQRGLDNRMIRFSPMMEENMLFASGAPATRDLYVSAAYFRSMVNGDALDLLGRYQGMHGREAPALNVVAESCYEGLFTWASLVRRAGSNDLRLLNANVDGVAYDGPRGTVEFHGRQVHQHAHLAVVADYDFDVITRL